MEITIQELAQRLDVSVGDIQTTLDRLVEKGLVEVEITPIASNQPQEKRRSPH